MKMVYLKSEVTINEHSNGNIRVLQEYFSPIFVI